MSVPKVIIETRTPEQLLAAMERGEKVVVPFRLADQVMALHTKRRSKTTRIKKTLLKKESNA